MMIVSLPRAMSSGMAASSGGDGGGGGGVEVGWGGKDGSRQWQGAACRWAGTAEGGCRGGAHAQPLSCRRPTQMQPCPPVLFFPDSRLTPSLAARFLR